jgi:hypothetical protein
VPLFYLNLTSGNDELPNDPDPQEFANLEEARIEAVASLREISGHAVLDSTHVVWSYAGNWVTTE